MCVEVALPPTAGISVTVTVVIAARCVVVVRPRLVAVGWETTDAGGGMGTDEKNTKMTFQRRIGLIIVFYFKK